jgi:hypothetical protein
MRYLVLLAVAATACGGAKPAQTEPSPARGLLRLTADDAQLSAIAVAAARGLPSINKSTSTPAFGGVYVDGRRARLATDAVVRATGFTAVSTPTRSGNVQCRAVSSTGKSMPVPCPPEARQALPVTYTFDEVRATADSAYVGVSESSDTADRGSCMTLVKRQGNWTYFSTLIMADPKRCGR